MQDENYGKMRTFMYGNKEERRVITGSEQETAKKMGEIGKTEVTRTDHAGTLYETVGPTTTEWKDPIIPNRSLEIKESILSNVYQTYVKNSGPGAGGLALVYNYSVLSMIPPPNTTSFR